MIILLNVVIWSALSLFTLLKNPRRAINRYFFYLCFCIVLHSITQQIELLIISFTLVLHLCWIFSRIITRYTKIFLLLGYLFCFISFFISINNQWILFLAILSSGCSLYNLFKRYKLSGNSIEKFQILSIIIGIIVFTSSFLLSAINIGILVLGLIFLFSCIYSRFLGVSITLFDISISLFCGLLIYLGTNIGFLLKKLLNLESYLPVFLALLLITFLYPYIRHFFLRVFFNFECEYLKDLLSSLGVDTLLASILDVIKNELSVKDAYFMVINDENNRYIPVGQSSCPWTLTKENLLAKRLLEKKRPLSFSDIVFDFRKNITKEEQNIEDELYKLNLEAVVPILKEEKELLGFLILPPNTKYYAYNDISLQYLSTIFREISPLIARKLYYSFGFRDTLLKLLSKKDNYTRMHCELVSEYAVKLAKGLFLPEALVEKIKYSAKLHDIGKLYINDKILNKPGRLTNEEFEAIKKHTSIGENLVRLICEDETVLGGIKWHHERIDGSGYPDGIKGECLPVVAKIIAVADAYAAMTTDRPYRRALSCEETICELKKLAGIAYENKYVNLLIKILKDEGRL